MGFIKDFISQYGAMIMYTIICGVFAYLGAKVKILADKFLNDKTKRAVVKTAVQAVEQIYKDLHGEDKLNAAVAAASDMLAEKGIVITDLELRMLIEAAVSEFNDAFHSTEQSDNSNSNKEYEFCGSDATAKEISIDGGEKVLEYPPGSTESIE